MHADICEPDDETEVQRFRIALKNLGAEPLDKDWALGVDMIQFKIGEERLTVFCDTYSIDIEGPDELVQRVLEAFHRDNV